MKTNLRYYYKAGEIYEYSENQITYQDSEGHSNVKITCGKCGGTGILPCYSHVDNGICFECMGAGHHTKSLTLTTKQEAEAKVEKYLVNKAKREAKKRAEALEKMINEYEALTDMYVVFKDTYKVKDYLKAMNYKYEPSLRVWYGKTKPDLEDAILIDKDDFYKVDEDWCKINLNLKKIKSIVDGYELSLSEYFGELDCTYTLDMKVENIKHITTTKYPTNLITLTNGNYTFNCFTNAYSLLDKIDIDNTYTFKFTVKSHDCFNNKNITYIKNIKLAK